jgi:membrane protein implicated in regulation of membrane protease activity
MVLFWVALGVVLLLVELRHLAFFALFGAAGAFGAALVALVAPDLVVLQVVVAVVVAAIGIRAVRPWVQDALPVHHEGRLARGVHGSLIGEEVLTLDTVTEHGTGHVLLAGERWLATSGSGDPIPVDTRVLVTGVDGTRLIVWPADGFVPPAVDLTTTDPRRPDEPTDHPPADDHPTAADDPSDPPRGAAS